MSVLKPRALLRSLRGFITIPGSVSLTGILVVLLVQKAEVWLTGSLWLSIPDALDVSTTSARSVLSTIAGAAMSALVMVYSIVLLVYTMAASSIGPRLLQRFSDDRVNQISVGTLGATFLYCTFGLWLIRDDVSADLTVAVALVYAAGSVLLLLYFVHRVSLRVTIDHEAAEIARALDDQIDIAMRQSSNLSSEDVVLPTLEERSVLAESAGYVDAIDASTLVQAVRTEGAVVVYAVQSGDFILEGGLLATVIGHASPSLDAEIRASAPLLVARDHDGDLRFSVHLLVEIALRALSPGVNDTFTAIACVDRLSASLTRARLGHLCTGVYCDDEGVVRVVVPTINADTLFQEAMPPLRRAASNNGLMLNALIFALERMADASPPDDRTTLVAEMQMLLAEASASDFLEEDRTVLVERIETVLSRHTESAADAS